MLQTVMGYVGAVIVTYLLAAAASAQHVIGRFEGMTGSHIEFMERLRWTSQDVFGMANPPIMPLAIAVMLLVAFSIAGFVVRRIGGLRTLGFVLAGALGMVGLHLIMKVVFEINSVAASRDLLGLVGQAVAGALGGLTYIWLHPIVSRRVEPHIEPVS